MMNFDLSSLWMPLAFQAGSGDALGGLLSFVPFLGIVAIFYFIVFLPARRRQKELQTLLGNLKKGDRVVTTGGIYGEIASVDNATVILKIADTVKLKIARTAIASLEQPEGDKGDNR